MKQTRELLNVVKDKLSKEDFIDIILELQEEINGWNSDNDIQVATIKDLRADLKIVENDRSNAWATVKQHRDRVSQLFGKFERIARILNQSDDVDGVNDTQIIEQIVEIVEDEIDIESGVFVNHKGKQL